MHFFHLRYKIPSEKTFRSSFIPDMAGKVRAKMKVLIKSAKDGGAAFSFTTDIWSSRGTDAYIGLTVHFLVNFERKNIMLNVSVFNASHTAENIAVKIQELLQFWGFDEQQIFMILRDNAANMKAAFRTAGYDSFGCLAHTFQVTEYDNTQVKR